MIGSGSDLQPYSIPCISNFKLMLYQIEIEDSDDEQESEDKIRMIDPDTGMVWNQTARSLKINNRISFPAQSTFGCIRIAKTGCA